VKDLLALDVTVVCFSIVFVARSSLYASMMNDMYIFIYLIGTERGLNCASRGNDQSAKY